MSDCDSGLEHCVHDYCLFSVLMLYEWHNQERYPACKILLQQVYFWWLGLTGVTLEKWEGKWKPESSSSSGSSSIIKYAWNF